MSDGEVVATSEQDFLRHYLAVLAYRTQKATRDAPPKYFDFQAGNDVRSPTDILHHMTQLMTYAVTRLTGGCEPIDVADPVERFHQALGQLSTVLHETEADRDTLRRLLQGPLADAMTHVGQLAMLRRLAESLIRRESFFEADITADNTSTTQPLPED